MNAFLSLFDNYVTEFYAIHVALSLVLSILVSLYASKRFVSKGEGVKEKDAKRLEEASQRGRFFKFLFKASLHKNNSKANFLFIFLFNLALPIIGYFFTLWIYWYLVHVKYEKKVSMTNMLNLDEFRISFLEVERIFGESSMSELIASDSSSKSKKLKALSVLSVETTPENLQIIKQTLTSRDDEIRMFGYAVINKAEKSLNHKINEYLELIRLETLKGDKRDEWIVASSSKELAFLYWEMVYTELSHESLKEGFLNSVVKYLDVSKKYYRSRIEKSILKIKDFQAKNAEGDFANGLSLEEERLHGFYQVASSLHTLMGRVYMQRKEYKNAMSEFTVAQELSPANSTFILPYLAEGYYLLGKYDLVKSVLKKAEGLNLNSTMHPIVQQWKGA